MKATYVSIPFVCDLVIPYTNAGDSVSISFVCDNLVNRYTNVGDLYTNSFYII